MSAEVNVLSLLPGVFYRRPKPDAPPFVEEGEQVQEGQIIGLIEVMKQFIEVKATVSGILTRFTAENEGPIDVDGVIASIRRT